MISIIIPLLNEESSINQLLTSLSTLQGHFEVIFVDGGSTDNTLNIIKKNDTSIKFTVLSSQKGRGIQMNIGVQKAQGNILWFVHSDSILVADSLIAIQKAIDKGYYGGSLSLFFHDYSTLSLKIIAFFSNIRARYFHSFYGDQGIFVTKQLFQQLGGFPNMIFLEDYEFSRLLHPYKTTTLPTPIGSSARRFIKGGTWTTIGLMRKIKKMYRAGVSPNILIELYQGKKIE